MQLAPDLPLIQADTAQMQQILLNLISNASEAVGEQAGTVTLSAGAQYYDAAALNHSRLEEKPAPGRYVWLEVADTGCGMDEETQKRMFEPFFTTRQTGRGLGLSAVLGIVRGHQGAIFVDSVPKLGTTIRVLFPALVPAPTPAASGGGESAQAVQPLSGTVLVVDDEEMVRNFVKRLAERLGLHVLAADDGAQALQTYAERPQEIACVILDLTMPRMDGATTFEAMRQLNPQVKVIMVSGYDEHEATQRFRGQNIDGFLQKPFEAHDLSAMLQRVLNGGV